MSRPCEKHPELSGARYPNGTCKGCQNELTRERNQAIRDKAKKYDRLAALVRDYLDEPSGLVALQIRNMLD